VPKTPLILVPKKDLHGKYTDFRPCLAFHHLNVLHEDEKFELHLICNIFRSLAGSRIFSTLDLKKAYDHFRIAKEDIHKTALTWRNVQYAFQGALFGLKTMPSIFQSTMSSSLGNLSFAQVFQDDIVVFSLTLMRSISII